jgi:UDP-N-acetyl-D-glucosamine dehydrogenase
MKRISKNPLTNKDYTIPEVLDDKKYIENFLVKNQGKPVVLVQGLGFVGAVMSIVCANALNEEYAVIGIDLPSEDSYWKIASINDGFFPVISSDPKVEQYYLNAKRKDNFYATYDTFAYQFADVVIVDINLDVQKESSSDYGLSGYDVDLSGFKSAIRDIGKNCKENILILIETTVPPGTTKIASEIIKNEYLKRGLSFDKVNIGHSYERVMPGPNYIDSIQNFYRVYSGVNEDSAESVESFLRTIIKTDKYPLTKLGNTNATEMSKVLENSYRAMNISFMVEWSRFAEEAGVNLYEVVDAIRMRPTHKNIMLPGIGVGGYCLTKDPLLASWSKKNINGDGFEGLIMSENAVSTNDKMPMYAFSFLKSFYGDSSLEGKTVQLLGVSYLSGVGDTRYSPVEIFYKSLIKSNCNVHLHDPYISFWDELGLEVSQDLGTFEGMDIVIFTTGHLEYSNNKTIINNLCNLKNITIYDTIGILSNKELEILSKNNIVKVLGRGDI